MEPAIWEALSRAIGRTRVDLLVGVDDGAVTLRFTNPIAQVGDEFLKGPDLGLGGLITIEVADETNAEGDVIEVVAGDMASVELGGPAVTDLDLAVAGAMSVANNEMVGEAVFHVADAEMVNIENTGISLTGAAVVDNDVFPTTAVHRGTIDGRPNRWAQVVVVSVRTEEPAEETLPDLGSWGRFQSLR